MKEYLTYSAEETIALAEKIGKTLPPNSVIYFFGDLGAGKTTFIKGLVSGASGYRQEDVNSPTFVYLNIYEGVKTIYHFDLYRLHDPDEFYSMGFHEFFDAGGICCIEWAERIQDSAPLQRLQQAFRIELAHLGPDCRKITIDPNFE
jgi:tRNA threonylcarbamoyladenosine biosynthesis protein TsaE